MARKNKSGWMASIIKIILAMTNLLSGLRHVTVLVSAEARLAGKSLVALCFLGCCAFIFFASAWLCVLALLFVYLTSWHMSPIVSLTIIFLLNAMLLVIMTLWMSRVKKNLFFPATRQQCKNICSLD